MSTAQGATNIAAPPAGAVKHTICGYAWGDVGNALHRSIAAGDMTKAQRWAAEMVCSESGLGKLEANLFHAWALFVGPANAPGWPQIWMKNIQHIRLIWAKSGGDIRTVRNTPSVRQSVAEVVSWLVVAPKRALPAIPKPEDCFRESEAMRGRLKAGGGAGDQIATRRVWVAGQDGHDLKTIGNEFEAALRANQTPRMLFWIVWLLTLDTQKECPPVKERAPPELTGKQRKSVGWFMVALLMDLFQEIRMIPAEDMKCMWELLATTWMKLGAKGRRDVFVALSLYVQEKCQKSLVLVAVAPPKPPFEDMKRAMSNTDEMYSEIAEEARKFIAETPQITLLTPEATVAATMHKPVMPNSMDRLAIAYKLAGR